MGAGASASGDYVSFAEAKEHLLRFNSSGDKAKELQSSKVELETKLSSLYSAPDDERGMTWGALRSHFPQEFAVAESKSLQERDGEEELDEGVESRVIEVADKLSNTLEMVEGAAETASSAAAFAQCWGESAIPDGAMALLEQVGIGAEIIGEFVPGVKSILTICTGALEICQACSQVTKEADVVCAWVVEVGGLAVRANGSFDTFPAVEVSILLKELSALLMNIDGRWRFSRWLNAKSDMAKMEELKSRLEKTIQDAGLQMTLELSARVDSQQGDALLLEMSRKACVHHAPGPRAPVV